MRRGRRRVARTVAHSFGGEAAGLAASGRGVGRVRSPKLLERAPGERPDAGTAVPASRAERLTVATTIAAVAGARPAS